MEQILQWFSLNIDKIVIWLTTTSLGGLLLAQGGKIIVSLIKNHTQKKYVKTVENYKNKVDIEIKELKEFVKITIKEEMEILKNELIDSFNRVQDKVTERKKEIYEEIFNKKMEVEEIVASNIEDKIDTIEQETENVIENIEENNIVEIQPEFESETPKKKIDLL